MGYRSRGLHTRDSFLVFVDGIQPIPARDEADIAVRTNQKNDVVFIRDPVGGVCIAVGVDDSSVFFADPG